MTVSQLPTYPVLPSTTHTRPLLVLVACPVRKEAIAYDLRYAKLVLEDCLRRGEDPIVSSIIRVEASLSRWYTLADALVVYCDIGLDAAMASAIRAAEDRGLKIIFRHLELPS